MNIYQLNAQFQRFPSSLLAQMGKQYGITIYAEQIDRIKLAMQRQLHAQSTLHDVEKIVRNELDSTTTQQLLRLLQQYFTS